MPSQEMRNLFHSLEHPDWKAELQPDTDSKPDKFAGDKYFLEYRCMARDGIVVNPDCKDCHNKYCPIINDDKRDNLDIGITMDELQPSRQKCGCYFYNSFVDAPIQYVTGELMPESHWLFIFKGIREEHAKLTITSKKGPDRRQRRELVAVEQRLKDLEAMLRRHVPNAHRYF